MTDLLTHIARARAAMMVRGHQALQLDVGPELLAELVNRDSGAFGDNDHGHLCLLTMRVRVVMGMEGFMVVPA